MERVMVGMQQVVFLDPVTDLEWVGELDFQLLEVIQRSAGLDVLQWPTCGHFASQGKGERGCWGSPIGATLTHQHQLGCLHEHGSKIISDAAVGLPSHTNLAVYMRMATNQARTCCCLVGI